VGVIAEEVAAVLPEVVAFEEDGRARGVNYGKLVSVLIEATKEQQQSLESKAQTIQAQGEVIEKQQTEIEALKERMNRLERLVEQAAGAPSEGAAADAATNDR
jgi:polyhydroxyalkanoate synthesis regulator phasin